MEVEGEPPEGAGVTCAKCGGPVSWRAMIDQRDAAMLARREAGATHTEVGAEFGLSTDAVVHALRRHRHRLREATGEQRPVRAVDRARRERDRRIMTAADAGESQRVIGEREGLTRHGVRHIILRERGRVPSEVSGAVPPRPAG